MNWAQQHAAAILEAWYPGEEAGTAVADVLSGTYNPAGLLPVTFYKSVAQLPPFGSYSMRGRTYRYFSEEPLYPFGYGLSYTTFRYQNAKVDSPEVFANDGISISAEVVNTGKIAGDEVVELYLAHPGVDGAPIRSLAGFERVHLEPGRSRVVSFSLRDRDLSVVGEEGLRRVLPGLVKVWIGGGQPRGGQGTVPGPKRNSRLRRERSFRIDPGAFDREL